MLKGIPVGMSPKLMETLLSMGHGDEIVIADGNFPSQSHNKNIIRADGLSGTQVLKNIMQFLPLDTYDDCVIMMDPMQRDKDKFEGGKPPIWSEYEDIVKKAEGDWVKLVPIDRFVFYERAKKAYAIVATSESAIYANIILKKGVLSPDTKHK